LLSFLSHPSQQSYSGEEFLKRLSQKEGWVLAEFKSKKITRAWIRESDLFNLYPEKMK